MPCICIRYDHFSTGEGIYLTKDEYRLATANILQNYFM